MTSPNAMPSKVNLIHQQILAGLIKTVPSSWKQKRIDPATAHEKKPTILETVHSRQVVPFTTRKEVRVKDVKKRADGVYTHRTEVIDVQVPTLAGNVSEANLNRAAERWIK